MLKLKILFYLLIVGLGLLMLFQHVDAAEFYDCAFVSDDTKIFLTSLEKNKVYGEGVDQIEAADEESAAEIWEKLGLQYEKVYCVSVSYKETCSIDLDCPVGFKCGSVEGEDKCSLETGGNCVYGETFLSNIGSCVLGPKNPEKDGACICKNGDNASISCAPSPLCSKKINPLFTGKCTAGNCDAGGKPGDTNACSDDLYCWQTVGVAKCCESNKCEGAIENCLNDYPGVCPTGFKYIDANFGCVHDCPEAGNECETDDDCKKGGQNKVCVELTKDSFATDKEESLKACQAKKIIKRCEFLPSPATPATPATPAPEAVPFPDVSVLNQLSSTDIKTVIGTIIKTGMGVMGSIALAMFVYAGVIMMIGSTSVSGGATKHDILKAKAIMVWAVLGMFVIFASYAIVEFVFEAFK